MRDAPDQRAGHSSGRQGWADTAAGLAAIADEPGRRAQGPVQRDRAGHLSIQHIPIEVPPGRAGMEPALSLTYAGSRSNEHLGVGWHIEGLSKITRCPRSFALDGYSAPVKNDPTDRFCIDGKRLEQVSSGNYGAEAPSTEL